MGKILINSGGGGNLSDDTTALLSDIVKNKTALTSDSNDEVGTGTLELTGNSDTDDVLNGCTFYKNNPHNKLTGTLSLTGNAPVVYVYKGKTFYNNNAKNKLTGTLTCNTISNFSVTVNSGRRVLCSWKNPTQASGKPYSGVYIKYSTSGYPGTGGTQIYKGSGSNTTSGGTSTVYVNLPNVGTKYYLSIYPYVTCSAGEIRGSVLNAQVTTGSAIIKTFTSSTTYTIPQGYTQMDITCVGGGGGGGKGYTHTNPTLRHYTGGGGGGYVNNWTNISVTAGQQFAIVVGAGGAAGSGSYYTHGGNGGTSSCGSYSANGGTGSYWRVGADGGSGGGAPGYWSYGGPFTRAGDGGSNGGNGTNYEDTSTWKYGIGQGTTTKAFTGTLYAGGGGGASGGGAGVEEGKGGSGGGGDAYNNGSVNTGGGGGGGLITPGAGGSGIVLIRLH